MKNKPALVYGTICSMLSILFLNELFQAFITFLVNAQNISIQFNWVYITCDFSPNEDFNTITMIISYTASFLFNIFLIELGQILVKKSRLGNLRFSLIIFLIINTGYLIFNVFYSAISILFYKDVNTDWNNLMIKLSLEEGSKIVFMFFIVLILIFYLNFSARRIVQYINVPH
jgi:hypothetical protein